MDWDYIEKDETDNIPIEIKEYMLERIKPIGSKPMFIFTPVSQFDYLNQFIEEGGGV